MSAILLELPDGKTVRAVIEYDGDLYLRHRLAGENLALSGHSIEFRSGVALRLWVCIAHDALALDFERESSRRDVGQNYVGRPGFFLSQIARVFRDCIGSAVLCNANNIGYWANQFAVVRGALVYKKTTPLFYDPEVDISGSYPFICQTDDQNLEIRDLEVRMIHELDHTSRKYRLAMTREPDRKSIDFGISGYPLLRDGEEVWPDALTHAWDPKLLYYVGDLAGVRRGEILRRMREARRAGYPLHRGGRIGRPARLRP